MIRNLTRGRTLALASILVLACLLTGAARADSDSSPLRRVTFTFAPPRQFDRVFLAGTFNGWSTDATPMRQDAGRWEITLPLAIGEYQYKFVADGEWITDEKAKRFLPDGYGGRNSVVDVDESFKAMDIARGDGRILLDGLGHREDAWERSLGEDGTVTIRVKAWKGDVEAAAIVWRGEAEVAGSDPGRTESGPGGDAMAWFDTDGTYDYYETVLMSPAFRYSFRLSDGDRVVVLDARGAREWDGSEPAAFEFDSAREAAFTTPDWVKDGVIYQIFPERFANGDAGNDPDFSEWYYEGLTQLPPSGKTNGEYFHFVDDWYDVAGLVRSPHKTDGKPDWNSFYGGDIEGVRRNLDYLEDLGVTIIYFNPVFEAKSNHKYDAVTYDRIDPHFGTNGEFTQFVHECHERGMRVVIDLAINHSGHTHWAFVDAREKGIESEYWDWYEFKTWPVPGSVVHAPANPLDYYDCWWGFGQMPNLNFDLSRPNADEQSVRDIAEADPNWPLVNHLLDVATMWLKESDVDGYRLDVAAEVPFWFWELFRERVRSVKPDAYILGELWGASPEWVNARYYDAVMNYKFFRDPVHAFIAREECDAATFDRALAPGRLIYAEEGVQAMMNLLDSHDTERFLTTVGGDVRRLKLATLFAMTYVGAPAIYYGDEIGMEGAHDPDCRRPFLWNWTEDPERVEIRDYVRLLTHFRRAHPCLTRGEFETLYASGSVFAFRRSLGDEHVVVLMNAGEEEATVTVPLGESVASVLAAGSSPGSMSVPMLVNAFDGGLLRIDDLAGGATVEVTLAPVSGAAFRPRVSTVVTQPETGK